MMAKKPKPEGKSGVPQAADLKLKSNKGEDNTQAMARHFMRPSLQNAMTLRTVMEKVYGYKLDLTSVMDELAAQCDSVIRGHMGRPEAVLTAQIHTLDALFNHLTQIAYRNFESLDVCERVFRLALRAQGQCRATAETLAAIKNPPMVFAKQANVTSGPQQINNGVAHGRDTDSFVQNKLLEQSDGTRLDTIAPGGAISSDSAVATLGTINRTQNG
jgi:hypothetical protein